jgi:hypothetical protein
VGLPRGIATRRRVGSFVRVVVSSQQQGLTVSEPQGCRCFDQFVFEGQRLPFGESGVTEESVFCVIYVEFLTGKGFDVDRTRTCKSGNDERLPGMLMNDFEMPA